MAIEAYSGTVPNPGAIMSVFLAGTQDFATLYADELLTPLANPFTTDQLDGRYLFYAEQAAYDLVAALPDEPPADIVPALPAIIFNGQTPARTATLVVEDPDTNEQVILAQTIY